MSYRGAFLTFSVILPSMLGGVGKCCVLKGSANDVHFRYTLPAVGTFYTPNIHVVRMSSHIIVLL